MSEFEKLLDNFLLDLLMFSEKLNSTHYLYLRGASSKSELKIRLDEEQYIYDNEIAQRKIKRINDEYECLLPYIQEGTVQVIKNEKESILECIEYLKDDFKNADKLGAVILNKKQIEDFAKKYITILESLLKRLDKKSK